MVAGWSRRRKKQPTLIYSHHSEQYRKAWFAGFPPELWPAEEVLADGKTVSRLKDGTIIPTG
jgi:hypothetical protein